MKLLQNLEILRAGESLKTVYVLGLCLNAGKIVGYKLYNKIYERSDKYHDYIKDFGGQTCLDHYLLDNNEWMNLYPGFSGFTLNVEYVFNKGSKAFGYKIKENGELKFKAFYLSPGNSIVSTETYKYDSRAFNSLAKRFERFECDLVEVSEQSPSKMAFCPIINHTNVPSIEYDIKSSLDAENVAIFDYIKALDSYFILNFGVNPNYEKIYVVGKDNRKMDILVNLIKDLENKF